MRGNGAAWIGATRRFSLVPQASHTHIYIYSVFIASFIYNWFCVNFYVLCQIRNCPLINPPAVILCLPQPSPTPTAVFACVPPGVCTYPLLSRKLISWKRPLLLQKMHKFSFLSKIFIFQKSLATIVPQWLLYKTRRGGEEIIPSPIATDVLHKIGKNRNAQWAWRKKGVE